MAVVETTRDVGDITLLPPAQRVDIIREAFERLGPYPTQRIEQTIRRACVDLAYTMAIDSPNPPYFFYIAGRETYQVELDLIAEKAKGLAQEIEMLTIPVRNGLLREGCDLGAITSALRQITEKKSQVDLSWLAQKTNGRPKATKETFIAGMLGKWYANMTGKRPTASVNPTTNKTYGPFPELVETVFQLLGYENGASRAKDVARYFKAERAEK